MTSTIAKVVRKTYFCTRKNTTYTSVNGAIKNIALKLKSRGYILLLFLFLECALIALVQSVDYILCDVESFVGKEDIVASL